ncbi:MAG: anti-sigma factor antagonist [Ilumatobacteraceae bacterium]
MAGVVAVKPWKIGDDISFDLSIRYSTRDVVVGVRGEVDLFTAPALGALLESLIDDEHIVVVLDLVELDFMDVSGLRVIAVTSRRLLTAGGALTLRSPRPMVLRLLDLAGMLELVEISSPGRTSSLGPEQRPDDGSGSLTVVPAAAVAVEVVQPPAMPAGNDVIDAALRLVTALARATVGGADGVSVALRRHGQLNTVAASDETIAQMDRDQYATGEGPCLSAATEGHWFHVESLAEEVRWPRFISRAMQDGIGSILSTPLTVSARPVGSLNIYSNSERAFAPQDQELAALFAEQASGILATARVDMTVDEVAQRLRDALNAREVIAQAQGVIMAQQGISADAAYAALRKSSKRTEVTVRDFAAAVVSGTLRTDLIGQVER